ncbi:MAG: RNA polymerase factor sigma-54 [Lentimicrobiaceae bacterium]|nr:RNA polymerase factor sigma-54 [Lentimicrobiaceae bacterium]
MALKLNQNLSQKLMQKLSPQQLQLMKLMQVTTMGLEQRIKEELQNNPALEEASGGAEDDISLNRLEDSSDEMPFNDDDSASDAKLDQGEDESDFDVSDYVNPDREDYAYKLKSNNYRDPEEDYQAPIRFKKGFQEQLTDELGMLPLDAVQRQIGEVIIGNLDQDGYLQRSVDAMVNDLAFSFNLMVTNQQVEDVLQRIQRLEPSGIGGRDLRECLSIQIRNRLEDAVEKQADLGSLFVLQTAGRILDKYFEPFVKHQYRQIAEKLKVSEEDLKEAVELIKTLDPKPGRHGGEVSENVAASIIPDFYLINDNGKLLLSINSKNDPDLRISPSYEEMLLRYEREQNRTGINARQAEQTKEAAFFVKQKIDSARWFMEMIQQRRSTMLNTMQAVVDFQHDYFLEGDISFLKPMRLKDIAQIIKMDVSTVSRVINNKYIQTHFGIFLVKSFFSQSIENEEGEEISTSQIKETLRHLIENEDKSTPLTDEELAAHLQKQGFLVARRTVAKYREGLGYPVARLRKQI